VHPLHNVGPLKELRGALGAGESQVAAWIALWMTRGFEAFEALIGEDGFCFGREPGLADTVLIPQLYAARRFAVPLDPYPRILRVDALAAEHPAFAQAHPARQADAE
jgi:glutathione S-transferase